MRKVIDDRPDGELALHVKGRLELARRGRNPLTPRRSRPRTSINMRVPHSRQVKRGLRFSFHVVGSPRTTLTALAG